MKKYKKISDTEYVEYEELQTNSYNIDQIDTQIEELQLLLDIEEPSKKRIRRLGKSKPSLLYR